MPVTTYEVHGRAPRVRGDATSGSQLAGKWSRHPSLSGEKMYKKPKLERFGTFRELTLSGTQNYFDMAGIQNNDSDSCDPTKTCWKPIEPTHS